MNDPNTERKCTLPFLFASNFVQTQYDAKFSSAFAFVSFARWVLMNGDHLIPASQLLEDLDAAEWKNGGTALFCISASASAALSTFSCVLCFLPSWQILSSSSSAAKTKRGSGSL
jgi:hypothetical protein